MSRNTTKHQRRQGRLAEKLVADITDLEADDENFSTALQFVVSNIVYHRYLDASQSLVEKSIAGLCTKFKVHVQQDKSSQLRGLVDEFLRRDLRTHCAQSDAHYAALSFLLHLSESPLRCDYEPEEWRVPDNAEQELSAAEWYKILHADDEMPISYSSGSDLEPWSSGDEDDDTKRGDGLASVGLVTEHLSTAQEDSRHPSPHAPAASSQSALHVTSSMTSLSSMHLSTVDAHHSHLQRKSFLRAQLTGRYWQQSSRSWPVTEVVPSGWLGNDHLLAALCSTAKQQRSVLHGPTPHYEVTEQKIVRETIWALCGSTHLFVYVVDESGSVSPRQHIQAAHYTEESLCHALNRFSKLATKLTQVRRFISESLHNASRVAVATPRTKPPSAAAVPGAVGTAAGHLGERGGDGGRCQTVQAFAAALNNYVARLTNRLCELEDLNRRTESCQTLLQLRLRLGPLESQISLLHDLVVRGVVDAADNRQVACHLLCTLEAVVSDLSLHGVGRMEERNMAISILLLTLRPYLAMIEHWMEYGSLIDPYKECLIVQNGDYSSDPSVEYSSDWWCYAYTLSSGLNSASNTTAAGVAAPPSNTTAAGVAAPPRGTQPACGWPAVPDMLEQSISHALQAGKSLCLLRTLEKMSTGSVHTTTWKEPQKDDATLFQDFMACLQRRLINMGDAGQSAAATQPHAVPAGSADDPPSDVRSRSGDTSHRRSSVADSQRIPQGSQRSDSLDSLSVGSVENFDIDREFRRADDVDPMTLHHHSAFPAPLRDVNAIATDRRSVATGSSFSTAVSARDEGVGSLDQPDAATTVVAKAAVRGAGGVECRRLPCARDGGGGYLAALAPGALLARNFGSLTMSTARLGNPSLQRQLLALQRSEVSSRSGGALSCVLVSTRAEPSSLSAVATSASSRLAGHRPGDDVILPCDDSWLESEADRLASGGSMDNTCAGRGAVGLFADDVSAVTRLVKTLPLYHVPLAIALKKSLPPLLRHRSRAICSQLAHILRDKYDLGVHLKHLQSYFLMEAGSVMHQFSSAIFQQICDGKDWMHTGSLNALLHESLSYSSDYDVISSLLSIDIVAPVSASVTAGGKRVPQSARRPMTETAFGFDHLTLLYRTEWPVDIVVNDQLLDGFNNVFRFLLHLKFAKWSLDNCFWQDTEFSRSCGDSPIYKIAFLLRVKLLHVVNAIHSYMMTRILHSVGKEYMERLATVEDVDGIIECFHSYVQLILDRCLLNAETSFVREAVLKLLRQAAVFRQLCNTGLRNASVEKISAMMDECDKCHTFLLGVFNGIIRRGAFPHLEALAASLSWKS